MCRVLLSTIPFKLFFSFLAVAARLFVCRTVHQRLNEVSSRAARVRAPDVLAP